MRGEIIDPGVGKQRIGNNERKMNVYTMYIS